MQNYCSISARRKGSLASDNSSWASSPHHGGCAHSSHVVCSLEGQSHCQESELAYADYFQDCTRSYVMHNTKRCVRFRQAHIKNEHPGIRHIMISGLRSHSNFKSGPKNDDCPEHYAPGNRLLLRKSLCVTLRFRQPWS